MRVAPAPLCAILLAACAVPPEAARSTSALRATAPAAARAAGPARAASQGEAILPFEQPSGLHGNGPILFTILIGGQPARMLLDTGASRTVLDDGLVARLGLETGLRLPAGGVGGVGTVSTVVLPPVDAGGFEFDELGATTFDLSFLEFDGVGVDGIFGSDLLHRCLLEVDFAARTLRFSPPEWSLDATGFEFLPLRWFAGLPVVEAQVAGMPARMLVDTGNLAHTTLTGPYFRRHFEPPEGPRSRVSGVGGEIAVVLGRLASVELGGRRFADVPAVAPAGESGGGLLDSPGVDGILGVSLLRHHRVLFDYPGGRIGLAAGPEWPELPRGTPGIALRREQGVFLIKEVFAGSDAEAAGLRRGDVLVSVEGLPVGQLTTPQLLRRIHGEPGSKIRLGWCRSGGGLAPDRVQEARLERRDWGSDFRIRAGYGGPTPHLQRHVPVAVEGQLQLVEP